MKRHEMSDEQWAALQPLLSTSHGRGRQWKDHRMLWVLNTGAAWQTVYHRFNAWAKDGTWHRISQTLLATLNRQRQIDWDLVAVDATHIRASRAAAGARKKKENSQTFVEPKDHALGRSRGGFTTKLHLACTMSGLPLAAIVSAGQSHESRFTGAVVDAISVPQERDRPPKRPVRVVCDKGYSYRAVKQQLRRRGIGCVIPTRSDQKQS